MRDQPTPEQTPERRFPIAQADRRYKGAPFPTSVPWSIADLAYSRYSALYGRDQSLERIAERGGFHAEEMDDLLPDWRERCSEIFNLRAQVDALTATLAHLAQERERLRGALELFKPGSRDGVWGRIKAFIVEGAPTRDEGIRVARQITEWQCVVDDALRPEFEPENFTGDEDRP